MLYYVMLLCYVMLCYIMLCCYVMLCYVMLCYVMLCYVMLCYVLLYRGYFMAARGYKFYLRVLKVSLTKKIKFVSPSGHEMFCLLYRD